MDDEQKYYELFKRWVDLELTDSEFKKQARDLGMEFWGRAVTCIGRGRLWKQ